MSAEAEAEAEVTAARPFRFEIFDANRANPVDASDGVIEIPSFTNIGSLGEVSGAVIQLDARYGWMLTRGAPGRGRPLDQFSLCRLTMGRPSDPNRHVRYIEARTLGPQSTDRGLQLKAEFTCLEGNLKDILVPGHWWFRTYREVLDAIVSHYNAQRGARQPELVLDADIPVDLGIPTNVPFNLYSGTDCHTAIEQLIDRLRQPAQAGGLGEFVSAYYTDRNPGDVPNYDPRAAYSEGDIVRTNVSMRIYRSRRNQAPPYVMGPASRPDDWESINDGYGPGRGVILHIVVQGARGTAVPTLEFGEAGDIWEIIRTRLPSRATRAILRGKSTAGSMPMAVARMASLEEEFASAPAWDGGHPYPTGSLVRHGPTSGTNPDGTPRHHAEVRWRAKRDVAAGRAAPADPSDDWEERGEWDHVGDDVLEAATWIHAARTTAGMWDATPQTFNTGLNSVTYHDSNLVVDDVGAWQDWVDYRVTAEHPLREGAVPGTRALVVGTAPTAFAARPDGSTPPTGLSAGQITTEAAAGRVDATDADFRANADNSIIQVGADGRWFVQYRFPALADNEFAARQWSVAVLGEGRIWEWDREFTAAAGTDWSGYAVYGVNERVTYTPTAADAAHADFRDGLAAGTRYVFSRIYMFADTVPQPPASYPSPAIDAARWELVGAYDSVPEDGRPVAGTGVREGSAEERRGRRTGAWSWQDISAAGITPNHCFHYPEAVDLVGPLSRRPDGAPANLVTGVRTRYRWDFDSATTPANRDGVTDLFVRLAALTAGPAWPLLFTAAGLAVPPRLADDVDSIFRGALGPVWDAVRNIIGYKNLGWWTTLYTAPLPASGSVDRRAELDLNNRNATPSGSSGWGAADADELDRVVGMRWRMRFDKLTAIGRILGRGNIPFRAAIFDVESGVLYHDFLYRLLGTVQDVRLSLSNFKPLISRAPVNYGNTLTNIRLPELLSPTTFNRRRIKRVSLHLMDNYDEHGRFWPFFSPWANLFESGGRLLGGFVDHVGEIEQFAWIKAPIAIAGAAPSENSAPSARTVMAPIEDRPNISNVVQLQAAAGAQAELSAWRLDNFTLRIPGRANVLAEQSIYLRDPRMVSEADAGDAEAQSGTLKLTVTRVSHSIQADGHGWITELTLVRRIRRLG